MIIQDRMINIIATVKTNKEHWRKMEEDESTTPIESDNEPYICSLRVGGKFNFYVKICMKRKYCLHTCLRNFCASLWPSKDIFLNYFCQFVLNRYLDMVLWRLAIFFDSHFKKVPSHFHPRQEPYTWGYWNQVVCKYCKQPDFNRPMYKVSKYYSLRKSCWPID